MSNSDKILRRQRRFPSAYSFYSLSKQYQIFEETNGEISIDEIGRRISTSWLKMTPGEKAKWFDKAEEHKSMIIAHVKQNSEPENSNTDNDVTGNMNNKSGRKSGKKGTKEKKRKKQKRPYSKLPKDPKRPKRPITAYLFFAQQMRPKIKEKNPEMKGIDITRQIGIEWNEATEKQKEPYMKLEGDSRKEYRNAITEWRQNKMNQTESFSTQSVDNDEEKDNIDTKDDIHDFNDDEEYDEDDDDDDTIHDDQDEEDEDDDDEEEIDEFEFDDNDEPQNSKKVQIDKSETISDEDDEGGYVDNEVIKTNKESKSDANVASKKNKNIDKNNNDVHDLVEDDLSCESPSGNNKGGHLTSYDAGTASTENVKGGEKKKSDKEKEDNNDNDKSPSSPDEQQKKLLKTGMSTDVPPHFLFHSRLPSSFGSNPVTMPHVMPPMPGTLPFNQMPVVPNFFLEQGQTLPHGMNPSLLGSNYFRRQQQKKK